MNFATHFDRAHRMAYLRLWRKGTGFPGVGPTIAVIAFEPLDSTSPSTHFQPNVDAAYVGGLTSMGADMFTAKRIAIDGITASQAVQEVSEKCHGLSVVNKGFLHMAWSYRVALARTLDPLLSLPVLFRG